MWTLCKNGMGACVIFWLYSLLTGVLSWGVDMVREYTEERRGGQKKNWLEGSSTKISQSVYKSRRPLVRPTWLKVCAWGLGIQNHSFLPRMSTTPLTRTEAVAANFWTDMFVRCPRFLTSILTYSETYKRVIGELRRTIASFAFWSMSMQIVSEGRRLRFIWGDNASKTLWMRRVGFGVEPLMRDQKRVARASML